MKTKVSYFYSLYLFFINMSSTSKARDTVLLTLQVRGNGNSGTIVIESTDKSTLRTVE